MTEVDAHCLSKAAGAAPRLGGANQNTARCADLLHHNIEHEVDTVIEIDVGVAGRAEDDLGAFCETCVGVCGLVATWKVRFGFRNASSQFAMDEPLAEQVSRDKRGWPGKEATI